MRKRFPLGFGDAVPPGFPLVHPDPNAPHTHGPGVHPLVTTINGASKGPGVDSGISCRTGTWRSRGSSAARSTGAGLESFGAIESYKKMEILGEGSYATVYRGYSQ